MTSDTSSADQWTIGRLLTWTTEYLKGHGSESPRLDSEVLLAHSRGCRRIDLYTAFEEIANESVRSQLKDLVRRRSHGTPVAYLVGHREFYSLSFRVTPDVLIPRPETEFVVITLLDLVKKYPAENVQIADVGTGSGILAICAAKHIPRSQITAIDISSAAIQVAQENATTHGVAEKIAFVEGDLFSPLSAKQQFHFVMSNPPYVSRPELEKLAPGVKDHEPELALLGGESGCEVIHRLIPQAAERLYSGGWFILEISPMIHAQVLQLLAEDGRFEPASNVRDLANHPRVIVARRGA